MTYRVTYGAYTEGDYESEEEAVKEFVECMMEDIKDGGIHIEIEVFNEKTEKWE